MKLRHSTVRLVTSFIIAALAGLVMLQYYFIRNAITLKEQAFDRNVAIALNDIVGRLERRETMGNVFRVAVDSPDQGRKMRMLSLSAELNNSPVDYDSVHLVAAMNWTEPPVRIQGDTIRYVVSSPQHVLLRILDMSGMSDTTMVNAFRQPGEYAVRIDSSRLRRGEFAIKLFTDSVSFTAQIRNGRSAESLPDRIQVKQREQFIGRIIDDLAINERESIEKRIRPVELDSIVRVTLAETGIELPAVYGVISERSDSLRILSSPSYAFEVQASGFKTRLFPNDFAYSRNLLSLYFPDRTVFLLGQIGPLLGVTLLLMGIIVFCFVYTIRTIFRQREFATRLVDFINNMTHEFKTPITTVSVAVDTMLHPAVAGNREKLERYAEVIREENHRMKSHVDRILQMAVLEEGVTRLKLAEINAQEILTRAISGLAVQIDQAGGKLRTVFNATESVVMADVDHFANIINNVLDNAVKYSPGIPEIDIATQVTEGSLHITIRDRGIGMKKEDLGRIFEKYYRVHTGNRHDVKGFGLGLSYVKLMTEAHGGSVHVSSVEGEGTTVELTFPLAQSRQGGSA